METNLLPGRAENKCGSSVVLVQVARKITFQRCRGISWRVVSPHHTSVIRVSPRSISSSTNCVMILLESVCRRAVAHELM